MKIYLKNGTIQSIDDEDISYIELFGNKYSFNIRASNKSNSDFSNRIKLEPGQRLLINNLVSTGNGEISLEEKTRRSGPRSLSTTKGERKK